MYFVIKIKSWEYPVVAKRLELRNESLRIFLSESSMELVPSFSVKAENVEEIRISETGE